MNMFKRRETPGYIESTAPASEEPKGADWQANVVTPYGTASLLIPAWYRGVTLIMQTMGQMKIQWQRMNGEGGNYIEDRWGLGRRINYLLQVRPNPLMTASQMQEQIEFRKIYYGNAYVYIERDSYGDPVALWLATGGSYNQVTDEYTVTYHRPGGIDTITVPSADVMHFKNVVLTGDMLEGKPTISFAIKALQLSATGDEQALQDMAKGGKHKVLIQEAKAQTFGTRGRANQQELRKMTSRFAQEWQSNDVVMLDNVADAKVISQTAQQLQLLEQRGYSAEDLCRILGIPKVMNMIGEGGSYKMPEHATQEFMLRTIQPRIREHEDEMNSKLLGVDDFGRRRVHICELALRRLDAKGQAEIDKLHLETGVNTVNELRNQYDLPNVKGGDINYVSTNLAELGSEKLRGTVGSGNATAYETDDNGGEGAEGGEE